MNKKDRMRRKIETETNQWNRLFLMIQYVCEYCSTEEKDRMEKFIREAAGYPEKAEA